MIVEFLEIIAAISEESQASLMTADAQTIIYNDGASKLVCTYFSCDITL